MRLVAQALAGPALKGGEMADVSPTGEMAALAKLTANWRSVIEDNAITAEEQADQKHGQKAFRDNRAKDRLPRRIFMSTAAIKPWVEVAALHPDVLAENFSEDIFALDLGPLADGNANVPAVYRDAEHFFRAPT